MRAPLVSDASTTTVASAMLDITALRIGKLRRLGGESGQNCETPAPRLAISRWRGSL
jgi:hypothetical protein